MGAHTSYGIGAGTLIHGDALTALDSYPDGHFQAVIADPPYFQVLTGTDWDTAWPDADAYLAWSLDWVRAAHRVTADDGLIFIFGQVGKREHVWLHLCSALTREFAFHDLLVWDRVVGYNDRADSFTPAYEMVLVLRKTATAKPYFDKDAYRLPYDEATIAAYLRDKRYKDRAAREAHLRKGKKATNIVRIPSLRGSSAQKVGHPSQKPVALIDALLRSSTRPGDAVLDPFLGSGTLAEAAERAGRRWVGVEADAGYVQMALTRLAPYAGDGLPAAA